MTDKESLKQKIDDLMEVTLNEEATDKERITNAVQAFKLIRKSGLLDATIVDKLLDEETSEVIESGEKLFRGLKRAFDKFQGKRAAEPTSPSGTRRRRRR